MTPAEIEWLRDHACKLAHGMGDPAEYIPWKAADEIDRLARQLAEVRERIKALYELALRQGDDAAIGLSHALDAFTAALGTTGD